MTSTNTRAPAGNVSVAWRLEALMPFEVVDTRNTWPSLAEVVRVKVPATERERFECWKTIGRATEYRSIFRRTMPGKILDELPPELRDRTSITMHFGFPHAVGQRDDIATRNLEVTIPPLFGWNKEVGDVLKWPGLTAIIGCAHDYDVKEITSCYRSGVCRKCGHRWTLDSGD